MLLGFSIGIPQSYISHSYSYYNTVYTSGIDVHNIAGELHLPQDKYDGCKSLLLELKWQEIKHKKGTTGTEWCHAARYVQGGCFSEHCLPYSM